MPIPMQCSCGKQLKVPDAYAGRRVKCNACGQSLNVPGGSPASGAEADTIVFACGCGRQMQTRAEFAGRTVKCPGCGQGVMVPAAAPAGGGTPFTFGQAPGGAGGGPPDFGFTRSAQEEAALAPRRRKRGSGLLWTFVSLAALLVLAGLALGTWLFLRGSSADLALVPADAQAFVSIRVADLWASKTGEDFQKQMPAGQKKMIEEVQKQAGIGIADVERVTLVITDLEKQQAWAIVTLSKALDIPQFAKAMGLEVDPWKYKDRTIQGLRRGGQERASLYPLTSKVLVMAPDGPAMKNALDQLDRKKTDGPLAGPLRQAPGRSHIVAGLAQPGSLAKKALAAGMGPDAPDFKGLDDLKVVSLVANLGSSTVDLEATGTFGSEQSASAFKGVLDFMKGPLQKQVDQMKQNAKGGLKELQQTADMLDAILKSLVIEQKGTDVTVKAKLPASPDLLAGLAVP
jgi:hypothetical protein